MPKLERLKEELTIQKQMFFLSIAVVLGLTGWLTTNLDSHWLPLIGGALAVVSGSVFCWSRFERMNQLLEEIEGA